MPRYGKTLVCVICMIVALGTSWTTAQAASVTNPPPVITSFFPIAGPPGALITLKGRHFTGATSVLLGATPTVNVQVMSDSRLVVQVPQTAGSGKLKVTTPYGVFTSTDSFAMAHGTWPAQTYWTQTGYNAQHTGYNPYETTISSANVGKLQTGWSNSSLLVSALAYADNILYVKPPNAALIAMNAATGKVYWQGSNPQLSIGELIIAEGYVFDIAPNGVILAYAQGGCGKTICDPKWSFTTGTFLNAARPTFANGMLFFASGYNLLAYDAHGCASSPCQPLWKAPITSDSGLVAVAYGNVYVFGRNELEVFSATGCGLSACPRLWAATLSDTTNAAQVMPVVANGLVYIGNHNGALQVFNASGCGKQLCNPVWSAQVNGPLMTTPVLVDSTLYVATDALYAFNAAACGGQTCQPMWQSQPFGSSVNGVVTANGVVYVATTTQGLLAYSVSRCATPPCAAINTVTLPYDGASMPIIVNGALYVTSNDYSNPTSPLSALMALHP